MCISDPNNEDSFQPVIILLIIVVVFLVGILIGNHFGIETGTKAEKAKWRDACQDQINELYRTNKIIPRNTYKIPQPLKVH